jgi:hypothetical protein
LTTAEDDEDPTAALVVALAAADVAAMLPFFCIYLHPKTPQKSKKEKEMPSFRNVGKFSGEKTLVSRNWWTVISRRRSAMDVRCTSLSVLTARTTLVEDMMV